MIPTPTLFIYTILMTFMVSYYFGMTILLRTNRTHNRNKLYQGILMTFWMVIIMFIIEPWIFSNLIILAISVIGVILFTYLIYYQVGINENQFLLSMKEHHQTAIDMIKQIKPDVKDSRVISLMDGILITQQEEIEKMDQLLDEKNVPDNVVALTK